MRLLLAIAFVGIVLHAGLGAAHAETLGQPVFGSRWERADLPVARGTANRSWTWGLEPSTSVLREPYVDSSTAQRTVQYLDESRMEITEPNSPATRP